MNATDAECIAKHCRDVLPLETPARADYGYPHLSLCVLDSVWSIGVRYEGVRNVVRRYRTWAALDDTQQETLSVFLERLAPFSAEEAADSVFGNRQRTSARGGILKSDAVARVARVLQSRGFETLADISERASSLPEAEAAIRKIPGQTSGVAWRYFLMLCGANHLVKPDRMILRFLFAATGQTHSLEYAQNLLSETARLLSSPDRSVSPRELDNMIWNYQRNR